MSLPVRFAAILFLAVLAGGCDKERVEALEEGVATEADVRRQFGEPEAVWEGVAGERIFEYDRQPAGQRNYMIGIGPDGRMTSLRQVLHAGNFAKIQPGMPMEAVRRTLGRPAKETPYPLKGETAWDWRYIQPPNTPMVFTVWFDRDWRVARTGSVADPDAEGNR